MDKNHHHPQETKKNSLSTWNIIRILVPNPNPNNPNHKIFKKGDRENGTKNRPKPGKKPGKNFFSRFPGSRRMPEKSPKDPLYEIKV